MCDQYKELAAMTDRLCELMGWEKSTSHKFEIIRQTCGGKAAALSIEKGHQLADTIESLKAKVAATEEVVAKAAGDGYNRGLREGIERFAWWKDGEQFVGTCGKTLADALKEIG